VGVVAAVVTAERVGDTDLYGKEDGSPRSAERQRSLPNRDPSLATSHGEAECDSNNADEPNNTEPDGETVVLISRRPTAQEALAPSATEVSCCFLPLPTACTSSHCIVLLPTATAPTISSL
jgi:hypothetical protein